MGYKKRNEAQGFWSHRPGYNWLVGYPDGGRLFMETEGIPEVFIDRKVKDSSY